MKRTLTTTTAAALALGISLSPTAANATEDISGTVTKTWLVPNSIGSDVMPDSQDAGIWPQPPSARTPQCETYWVQEDTYTYDSQAVLDAIEALDDDGLLNNGEDHALSPSWQFAQVPADETLCVVEEPEVPVDPEPPVDEPVDPPVVVDPPVDEPVDPPITDTPPPVDVPVVDEPTTPTVEKPETPEKVETIAPVVKAETPTTDEATPVLPNAGGTSPLVLLGGLAAMLLGSLVLVARRIGGRA